MRKYILLVVLAVSIAVNIVLIVHPRNSTKNTTEFKADYPLLAEQLSLEDHNDVLINFDPLRKQVKAYLANMNMAHSFYFEYLPSGVNIRDGEDKPLIGASLLKLPLVIDLYKAKEQKVIDLDKKVTVTQDDIDTDSQFGNSEHLKSGDQLTLREAAQITLRDSDNTAAFLIRDNLEKVFDTNSSSYNALDITTTRQQDGQVTNILIGAKSYSSVLKCLYLSCVLTPSDSQEILNYLSRASTTPRIEGGVPSNVTVANKLGSFGGQAQNDCAIVYPPNRPYLLCMMFIPGDKNIEANFQEISKMVYDYTTTKNKPRN